MAFLMILVAIGVFSIWVLLPLLPAVLIYRLFPNNPLVVNGPLAGLTVKTGGAFGAYLLIVLLTWVQIEKINGLVWGLQDQVWTVKGRIQLVDEKEKPVNSEEWTRRFELVLSPAAHSVDKHLVKLRLVEDKDGLPVTELKVKDFGSHVIDWNEVKRSTLWRTIDLGSIKIRSASSTSTPVAAQVAPADAMAADSSVHPAAVAR
jgi:hypothetical protein